MNAPGRLAGVVCVLLLHVGLLWLLNEARTSRPEPATTTDLRVTVRMLPAAPTRPTPITPAATAAQDSAATAPAVRRAARNSTRSEAPVVAAPRPVDLASPAAPETPAAQTTLAATPPAPSASTAVSIDDLLDSDATRNAIRASARAPSMADRVAAAGGEPAALSTADRLGQSVARGARGDCAKGEYLGGGMGLLSLPFLAAAALSEKCAR